MHEEAMANTASNVLWGLLVGSICQTISVDPGDAALHYIGRWDHTNASAPAFQWPVGNIDVLIRHSCTNLEGFAQGSAISFHIECASPSNITAAFTTHDYYTKFGVYLNEATGHAVCVIRGPPSH